MRFNFILSKFNMTCLLITALIIFYRPVNLFAQNNNGYAPNKSGISLNSGYTYDPSDDIYFLQASLFRLYDYDRVWKHKAPDSLRFKVEGSVGSAFFDNNMKLIANVGALALIYLDRFETDLIKPYLEAGIGVIYTDYRVKGQDYRFNFNPQAGIGIEFKRKGNHRNRFASFRIHHVSNGGLGSFNRGQNSIVLSFGQYF